MATRKYRNIIFRNILRPSGSSQICIISRNIFVLLLLLMIGSRSIHHSSFALYVMCHYYIKKMYGPTERGTVT